MIKAIHLPSPRAGTRVRFPVQHAGQCERPEPKSGVLEEPASRGKGEVIEWIVMEHEDQLLSEMANSIGKSFVAAFIFLPLSFCLPTLVRNKK